jgi:hydroxymethylpyrimidine/phosphomethylpyrimidine kinase
MLPTREIIETVADIISSRRLERVVVDPVVRATSGHDLIDQAALDAMIEKLFPLADVVTPNIAEAERIAGIEIASDLDIGKAAAAIRAMDAKNVLIKGGHLPSTEYGVRRAPKQAVDRLFFDNEVLEFAGEYIDTTATHGTGCTFAAAIAANLALGKTLVESVRVAKEFVAEAIRTAPMLGRGNSPINI